MRLGVMGGTFDPIHHGHLVAASEVQTLFGLDEVVFVPTGAAVAEGRARRSRPAEHRYLMTVIATASNPRFTVSRVDIDRDGPDLHDRHPARPARRSARTPSCSSSPAPTRWPRSCRGRTPTSCSELAHFIGVTRPGHELSDQGLPADRVTPQEVPAMAISSTDCRARVAAGEPVWYLVPDGVVQYINKYRLYARRHRPAAAASRCTDRRRARDRHRTMPSSWPGRPPRPPRTSSPPRSSASTSASSSR